MKSLPPEKRKEPSPGKKNDRKDLDRVALLNDLFERYLKIFPQEEEMRHLILLIPFPRLKERIAVELICRFLSHRNFFFVVKNVPTLANLALEEYKKIETKTKQSQGVFKEMIQLC